MHTVSHTHSLTHTHTHTHTYTHSQITKKAQIRPSQLLPGSHIYSERLSADMLLCVIQHVTFLPDMWQHYTQNNTSVYERALGPFLRPKVATTLTKRRLYCMRRLARPVFFFFFSWGSTCQKRMQLSTTAQRTTFKNE